MDDTLKEIEELIANFFLDFQSVNFDGYRRFFAQQDLILIMPGMGVLRGLDSYLEYESRSSKLNSRHVEWVDRQVDMFDTVARAMGLITMSFSDGTNERQIRENVTFLLRRDDNAQWKCFHLQATIVN